MLCFFFSFLFGQTRARGRCEHDWFIVFIGFDANIIFNLKFNSQFPEALIYKYYWIEICAF